MRPRLRLEAEAYRLLSRQVSRAMGGADKIAAQRAIFKTTTSAHVAG
jgi:hypothetical protein